MKLPRTNIYNSGFSDLNETTVEICNTIFSNNGDGDKTLMTVASTIYNITNPATFKSLLLSP